MQTIKRNKSIGLDIGQSSTKLLCLARRGHKAVIRRGEIFRLRDEGILDGDESEQFQAIGGWLKDLKLSGERVVLGLPQYMATTQLSDFAKGAKGAELDKMVGYETLQLSGISDDVFLHDYAVLPAGSGRVNPVLIGLCREANVNDFAERALNVSIRLEDIAMSGLAMANAFVQLRPEAWQAEGLQLLMDMGTEATTLVLLNAGQVLYIGGMMFGGLTVTQELSRQLQVSMDEAERQKLGGEVDWASLNLAAMGGLDGWGGLSGQEDQASELSGGGLSESVPHAGLKLPPGLSPGEDASESARAGYGGGEGLPTASGGDVVRGLPCFRSMVRELENCLDHWRSSELPELAEASLGKIWLCGGGGRLDQVSAYLEVSQGCDVEVFGPCLTKDGPEDPEFVVAYGLGLQGLGLARYSISLTPSALTWTRGKELRGKYLVISFLLLLGCLGGWYYYRYSSLVTAIGHLEEETASVKESVKRLGKLDDMKSDYVETLLQVLPIVENNIQTARFLHVLTLLQDAVRDPGVPDCRNWCVYVADGRSFTEYNVVKETVASAVPEPRLNGRRSIRRTLLDTTEEESGPEDQWRSVLQEEEKVHDVIEIKPQRVFYVVGVIMSKYDNHNKIEEGIMTKLKQSRMGASPTAPPVFSEVQLMTESERGRCKTRAVYDWENCLVNMRTSEAFKSYEHRSFFLRLTLADPGVEVPERNPLLPKPKAGRKRKR